MTDEQIEALWLRVTGFTADGDPADIIGFARALLADGGKGEAVARYDLSGEFMKPSAYGEWVRFDDTAPQAECAPRSPYGAPFTTDVEQCCGDPSTCNDPCEPPSAQAECAPREAQPIYQVKYESGAWIDHDKKTFEYFGRVGYETRAVILAAKKEPQP